MLEENVNIGPKSEDLEGLIERLEAKLPPGPWELWTSCSFRRIGGPEGKDGDVLHAYNQRSDGHPDLSMPEEQLQALVDLRNALPALLSHLRRLQAEKDDLRLAICGGEDAPGYNASLSHETILRVLADNYASARRDAGLAWDGETANTWKSRAAAAEARVGALQAEKDEAESLSERRLRAFVDSEARVEKLREAGKALNFGAYPAHGSGFVIIVQGPLDEFLSLLNEDTLTGRPAPDMTQDINIEELERIARTVTPGDIDGAPESGEYGYKESGGWYECPACDGKGEVPGASYCNFDDKPLGVQFFGIGPEFEAWEAYFRAFRPAAVLALLSRLQAAEEQLKRVEGERDRYKPTPHPHEGMWSVVYRPGAPTAEDYDEAVEGLQNAKRALIEGDSMGCRVCEDGGHGANQCHHNPLLIARKWAAASRFWQCWHCGFVATNDEEGREHFGHHDGEEPSCVRAALDAHVQVLEARLREAVEVVEEAVAFYDGLDQPHTPGEPALLDRLSAFLSSMEEQGNGASQEPAP